MYLSIRCATIEIENMLDEKATVYRWREIRNLLLEIGWSEDELIKLDSIIKENKYMGYTFREFLNAVN